MRIHNLLFALTLVAVAVATGWWTRPEPIPEPALGVLTTESRGPEVVVRLTNVGGRPLQVTTCGYGEPCAADLSVDFHTPSGAWLPMDGPRCGTGLRVGQLAVEPGQTIERVCRPRKSTGVEVVATVTIVSDGKEVVLSSGHIDFPAEGASNQIVRPGEYVVVKHR